MSAEHSKNRRLFTQPRPVSDVAQSRFVRRQRDWNQSSPLLESAIYSGRLLDL